MSFKHLAFLHKGPSVQVGMVTHADLQMHRTVTDIKLERFAY